MLRAKINFPLFKAIFALVVGIILCGCEPDDVSREDIPTFLSQYDPAMKAKRDEMVRSLTATREQLSKLRSLQYSYSSERAKSYVGKQISKVEAQEARLADILGRFDASIEVAMAAKEMDAADGGGLHTKESRQIISQADQIVKQSNELSSDVTSLFSEQRPTGNPEDGQVDGMFAENAGNEGMRMAVIDDDDGWSNLRALPSTNARIVRRIYPEEVFMVGKAQGRWYQVRTDSGETGWMHATVIRYTDS